MGPEPALGYCLPMQIHRRTRRPLGWALLIGGAMLLLALGLYYAAQYVPTLVSVSNQWFYVLSEISLVVAFIAFGTSGAVGGLGRLAFAAGAVGWLIIAGTRLVSGAPGVLGTVGLTLALLGSLIGGVVVVALHVLRRSARLAVLVTFLLGALYLLNTEVSVVPSAVDGPLAALFGLGLVISGILVARGR